MSHRQSDEIDMALWSVGLVASLVMVDAFSGGMFGVSLGDTFDVAGISTTWAWVLSLGTALGIVLTNDNSDLLSTNGVDEVMDSDLADIYKYAIIGTAAVLVAWVFVPGVADFFQSSDLYGLVYVVATNAATFALGWMY